ncbi:MAG TPA: ECF transporter S component, partial [[Clostridium] spiroforme]|nr:ECF transporter S component [Thomasclavelia spiroformis]
SALAYISFTFLQIKIPTPGGTTLFHLGNTFCILAALLLGGIPGGLAGAIGMGIGDLLDPTYVTYAPKTIILKLLIGIFTGLFAHRIFKINNSKNDSKLFIYVIISSTAGMLFNIIGEPIFGYFYNLIILGTPQKAAATLASWNAITTVVNAIITIILSSSIYLIIRPRLIKNNLLMKLSPDDSKKYK